MLGPLKESKKKNIEKRNKERKIEKRRKEDRQAKERKRDLKTNYATHFKFRKVQEGKLQLIGYLVTKNLYKTYFKFFRSNICNIKLQYFCEFP